MQNITKNSSFYKLIQQWGSILYYILEILYIRQWEKNHEDKDLNFEDSFRDLHYS